MSSVYPLEWPCFFTSTIYQWKQVLKYDSYKDIIIESLQYLVKENRVILNGYVVMSNHVHFIWQPKQGSYTGIQSAFMKFTANRIKAKLQSDNDELLSEFLVNKYDRKYQVWKREPLIVELFTTEVLEQKLEYIHQNPVRAGLCRYPEEYFYSSASFYHDRSDKFGIITDYRG